MKNLLKLIGIIAVIAVFGFSFAACGNPEEEAEVTGKLTITGFSNEDNDKLIEGDGLTADGVFIFAAKSYDADKDDIVYGVIKNRRVTLSLWEIKDGKPVGYTGNLSGLVLKVYVYTAAEEGADDPSPVLEGTSTVTVTLKKGVAIAEIVYEGGSEQTCSHIWNSDKSGVCTECGVTHSPHDWSNLDGECADCGFVCSSHDWSNEDGECAACGFVCNPHEDNNSDNKCDTCGFDMI